MNKILQYWEKLFIFLKSTFFIEAGKVFGATALASIFGFITNVIVVRSLNVRDFGLYASYINILSILTGTVLGGLHIALVRYLSLYLTKNLIKAKILTKKILITELVFGIAITIIGLFGASYIAKTLLNQADLEPLIRIIGLNVMTVIGIAFLQTIFQAEQRFNVYILLVIAQSILNLLGTIVLFLFHKISPLNLAFVATISSGVMIPLSLYYLKSSRLIKDVKHDHMEKLHISEIFHYTKWLVIASVATYLFLRLDVFMLTRMTSLETVASYSFANAIYVNLLLLLSAINTILLPKISILSGSKKIAASAKKVFISSIAFSLCAIPTFIFIKPLVHLVFGNTYMTSLPLLYIMMGGLIVSLGLNPLANFVFILKQERFFAYSSIFLLASNLIGNLIFIPKYGAYGAVIVTVVAIILSNVMLVTRVLFVIRKRLEEENYKNIEGKETPSLLLITELYPNIDNPFLGTFVVSQINELVKWYHIVVIVPYLVTLKSAIMKKQKKVIKAGSTNIYYISEYPIWLRIIYILHFISHDRYTLINKKLVSRKIQKIAIRLHRIHKFKLVHGHEVYIGDEAAKVGVALSIPSVITLHGLYEYHEKLFGTRAMIDSLDNILTANKIIAVSEKAALSYKNKNRLLQQKSIKIIPNGLPSDKYDENRTTKKFLSQHLQNLIGGKIVILGVGFFAKEKRFDLLIEAIAKIKKIEGENEFIVFLIGGGEMEPLYQELIRKYNLEKVVYILGKVSPVEMAAYYQAADVLVHPSIIESFSMVCLEAMSFAVPFICTSEIGITEYIISGVEGIVIPPNSLDALEKAIEKLISNKSLRIKMGQAGAETARKFIWSNQVNALLDIYNYKKEEEL